MTSQHRAVRPPRLRPGSRIALVSPGGPVAAGALERALDRCRRFGFEGVPGHAAEETFGYLAGPDPARAADLQQAIEDVSIDGIWALRGGYGVMRLLPYVDLQPLVEHPKAFIGFSDNTALHLALGRTGLVSFHGPHAAGLYGEFAETCLGRVISEARPAGRLTCPSGVAPVTLAEGTVEAPLTGGNLMLLAAACGTPNSLEARGRILVIEDVGEAAYRIDRAFTQLRQARCLEGVAGIVLGWFSDRPSTPGERDFVEVMRELVEPLDVPAILGAPVGHIEAQWTLPLGVAARLDAGERTLTILETAVEADA